jgi:hypothetical protein
MRPPSIVMFHAPHIARMSLERMALESGDEDFEQLALNIEAMRQREGARLIRQAFDD